jgi:hypothetical protein
MKRNAFIGMVAMAMLTIAAARTLAQPPAFSDGPIPAKPVAARADGCTFANCCAPRVEVVVRHVPEWSCRCYDFCLPKCSLASILQGHGCCSQDCACCKLWHKKVYLKFDCECERCVNRCEICSQPVQNCCPAQGCCKTPCGQACGGTGATLPPAGK